jgi:hypothetical protein
MNNNRLKEYTDYLIQILDTFDFDDRDWPRVWIVNDEYDMVGQAPVCEELADILREVKERMIEEGDYEQ